MRNRLEGSVASVNQAMDPSVNDNGNTLLHQRILQRRFLQRKEESTTGKQPQAGEETPEAKAKADAANLEGKQRTILLTAYCANIGLPISETQKRESLIALESLDDKALTELIEGLKRADLMSNLMEGLGEKGAATFAREAYAEIQIPAVVLGKVKTSDVEQAYAQANKLFAPYNLRILMPSFTRVDGDAEGQSILGNNQGRVSQAGLESRRDAAIEKLLEKFVGAGSFTAFFSDDFDREGSKGYKVGHAIRRKGMEPRYGGKEGVFLSNPDGNTFAHEIGHIIGGSGPESDHSKENNNLMRAGEDGIGNEVSPQQLVAFKSSLYVKIHSTKQVCSK